MSKLHEPRDSLSAATLDLHRALSSLMEEIEAVDWYQQRVDACADDELRSILAHNRDEEIEHAVMTLEWVRRRSPRWDAMLREFLFVEGDARPDHAAGGAGERRADNSLGVAAAINAARRGQHTEED